MELKHLVPFFVGSRRNPSQILACFFLREDVHPLTSRTQYLQKGPPKLSCRTQNENDTSHNETLYRKSPEERG